MCFLKVVLKLISGEAFFPTNDTPVPKPPFTAQVWYEEEDDDDDDDDDEKEEDESRLAYEDDDKGR